MAAAGVTPIVVEVIPLSIAKNLPDRSYEKRKAAAMELEHFLRDLQDKQDEPAIRAVLDTLRTEYAENPNPNRRKGGLIGLAAVAIALHETALSFLDPILRPTLALLSDDDPRVRYYACEALYNITKVVRGHVLVAFNQMFRDLCKLHAESDKDVRNAAQLLDRLVKDVVTESEFFDIEQFIPLLRETVGSQDMYVRQFVIGWITVLDSVPDIEMLEFLPEFLGGLFDMLADSNKDIRQQADAALEEFLHEIKNTVDKDSAESAPSSSVASISFSRMIQILVSQCGATEKPAICRINALNWLQEFIDIEQTHGLGSIMNSLGNMCRAIIHCISSEDTPISQKADQTNNSLLQLFSETKIPEDQKSMIVKSLLESISKYLLPSAPSEPIPTRTRIATLKWISTMLATSTEAVSPYLDSLYPVLLTTLSAEDDVVLSIDIKVLAKIASIGKPYFESVIKNIMRLFASNQKLLDSRGGVIIRKISVLLDPDHTFRTIANLLVAETDMVFASTMVQTLNLILLTSSELFELREYVKRSLQTESGRELFVTLYNSW
jgi:vacuole morphology and inheritance protein 14